MLFVNYLKMSNFAIGYMFLFNGGHVIFYLAPSFVLLVSSNTITHPHPTRLYHNNLQPH